MTTPRLDLSTTLHEVVTSRVTLGALFAGADQQARAEHDQARQQPDKLGLLPCRAFRAWPDARPYLSMSSSSRARVTAWWRLVTSSLR